MKAAVMGWFPSMCQVLGTRQVSSLQCADNCVPPAQPLCPRGERWPCCAPCSRSGNPPAAGSAQLATCCHNRTCLLMKLAKRWQALYLATQPSIAVTSCHTLLLLLLLLQVQACSDSMSCRPDRALLLPVLFLASVRQHPWAALAHPEDWNVTQLSRPCCAVLP